MNCTFVRGKELLFPDGLKALAIGVGVTYGGRGTAEASSLLPPDFRVTSLVHFGMSHARDQADYGTSIVSDSLPRSVFGRRLIADPSAKRACPAHGIVTMQNMAALMNGRPETMDSAREDIAYTYSYLLP
jgi:hypothetical protein